MFTDSQIRYLVRESLLSLKRMKGISIVSMLIMSIALLMLALFTLVTVNLRAVASSFQKEIDFNSLPAPSRLRRRAGKVVRPWPG